MIFGLWILSCHITVASSEDFYKHSPEDAAHYEKKLIERLTQKSPRYTPPYGVGATFVTVDPMVRQILGINEREGHWTASIVIFIRYENEDLIWNPEDYGNVSSIEVSYDLLWTPVVG